MNLASPALVAISWLAACTSFESQYERGVYDYEPLYCYQTLGGVDCHRQPHHRDAARLVNYYGPAPGKYKAPKPAEENPLRAPPKVSTAAYDSRQPARSAESDAEEGGSGDKSEATAVDPKAEWKEWLPLVSVAFGAMQVVAAFAF